MGADMKGDFGPRRKQQGILTRLNLASDAMTIAIDIQVQFMAREFEIELV
jgi:hypothetical protein